MRKHALHLTRIVAGLALTVSTTATAGVLAPSMAMAATTSTAKTTTSASTLPATIGQKITTTSANVRTTGDRTGTILTTLPASTVVAVTGATTASYSQVVVNGRAGWVYSSYLRTYSAPSTSTKASTLGQKAANYALAQVGKDYAYGKTGPDAFDCSGLVVAAYRSVGLTAPHSHAGQASMGTSVSRNDLRPGDVLALGSSMQAMALYVGNDTIVIADGPGYGVRTDNLTNRLKWEPLYTARRYA